MPRRPKRATRWLRGLAALLVLPLLGLAAVAAAQTPAPRPPAIYYAHTDHLGTPHALTDETGAVVWQAEYTPFGTATVSSDGVVLNLRFPGQYYDQETGLHYNYFRTYDSGTGRYLESDPIGLRGGLNTYLYANANPTRYIDPTGESALGGVLTGLGADLATPEPTDAAWPKWVGWGVAAAGAAIYDMCSDNEEECLEEIQGCMQTCRTARDNKHRMRDIWGGSWWRCMTGCVSFECQDYLDERKHGEY